MTPHGRCPPHALRERDRPNVPTRRWYRTPKWKALRARLLVAAAYECASCHTVTPTLDVDHIVPHHGDDRVFWDLTNLQVLCKACHSKKTQAGT